MGRPKSKAPPVRSRVVFARLREAEEAGLKHLAARLGQTPSRIIRRLIREAVTGGPDYFDDGLLELGRMHRELAAIGSNLNQLARAANRGAVVGGEDVRRVINAGIVQMEAVKGLYQQAVRATEKRVVVPLYQEAGVSAPVGGQDPARATEPE